MRVASFVADGRPSFGVVTDDGIVDLGATADVPYTSLKEVLASQDELVDIANYADGRQSVRSMDTVEWLPPVPDAGKILCVGVNYPSRNDEYRDDQAAPDYPSIFVRFPSTFVGHEKPLVRPAESPYFDYEGEVAVIIGRAGRRISIASAMQHVAGMTLANDGSVRDWVRHGKFNVTPGKNFDRSGSIGPWMTTLDDPTRWADVRLETAVNGEVRQQGRLGEMLFGIPYLLHYVSTFTTLEPGDILLTGTPPGAGARQDPPRYLEPGDVIDISATGLGALSNRVVEDEQKENHSRP